MANPKFLSDFRPLGAAGGLNRYEYAGTVFALLPGGEITLGFSAAGLWTGQGIDLHPLEIVDVSYQPDTLGPKPISHAAPLVDYLNGELEPYDQAHRRLLDLAARIDQRAGTYFPVSSALEELAEIGECVRQLKFPTTTSYAECARLFERENLMLLAVQMYGCGCELDPLIALLDQWRRDGLLTADEANDLVEAGPLRRMVLAIDDGP